MASLLIGLAEGEAKTFPLRHNFHARQQRAVSPDRPLRQHGIDAGAQPLHRLDALRHSRLFRVGKRGLRVDYLDGRWNGTEGAGSLQEGQALAAVAVLGEFLPDVLLEFVGVEIAQALGVALTLRGDLLGLGENALLLGVERGESARAVGTGMRSIGEASSPPSATIQRKKVRRWP